MLPRWSLRFVFVAMASGFWVGNANQLWSQSLIIPTPIQADSAPSIPVNAGEPAAIDSAALQINPWSPLGNPRALATL
jgi:hypothetical protein